MDRTSRSASDALRDLEAVAPSLLLSDDEVVRIEGLPADKRLAAITRLTAIAAWKRLDGGARHFETAADAAKWAGVPRSVFFQIMREVATTPVLEKLGLNLGRVITGARPAPRHEDVARQAASILRDDPAIRMQDVLRALKEGAGADLSTSTLVRIVDQQRMLAPPRAAFGSSIHVDSAAAELVDASGNRQRLHAVVDVGTLLILSSTFVKEGDFLEGFRCAGRLASGRDGKASDLPALGDLEVAEGPGAAISIPWGVTGTEGVQDAFFNRGWGIVRDPRRVGRQILSALGRTIAGVRLTTGYIPPGERRNARAASLPVLTGALSEMIGNAIREHNDRRLGLARKGDGRGAADLVREVADILEIQAL